MFVVSWNFLVISKGSFIEEYLNVKVAAHELFSCLLKTMWFISLSYTITTPKIFRINLSVLYLTGNYSACSCFLKSLIDVENFVAGSLNEVMKIFFYVIENHKKPFR